MRQWKKLQWGRAQVSAEIVPIRAAVPRLRNASMGPRSGERGNNAGRDKIFFLLAGFNGAALR